VSEFPGVALAFSVIRTRETGLGENKTLCLRCNDWERGVRERVEDDRTEIRGGAAIGQADVR